MNIDEKCQICEKQLGNNEELIIAVKTQNGKCVGNGSNKIIHCIDLGFIS